MRRTTQQLAPWLDILDEIQVLSGIAQANGSVVSLKDLATLTRTNLSQEQIESSWKTIPDLATTYELKNGLIIQREFTKEDSKSSELALEKRARAEDYTRLAVEFASICNAQDTNLFAISGSTSYKTPMASDDVDIFCITKPDKLWLFITKSLLLARILRIFRRDFPRICFSYALDQRFAKREFFFHRDALFARDALTAVVIHGHDYYEELLKNSSWISNYFPRLYQQRTDGVGLKQIEGEHGFSPQRRKFLNTLLRILVGNYIAFKSAMLNRSLRRQGKFSLLFRTKIGPDHSIFESIRYCKLRTMYLNLNMTSNPILEKETFQFRGA